MKASVVESMGRTQNYMHTQITVKFYSVYDKHGMLRIYTSDKKLALQVYTALQNNS